MNKMLLFQDAMRMLQPRRSRYIIIIDQDNEPTWVSQEFDGGLTTVLVNARTPEEAEQFRKESAAALGIG